MAYLVVGSNVNITLDCDEVNSSLPLKKGNNTYYVGYADERNYYTGNYDKGPVPTLHYNNNNWISFHIGEVDQTQTAAPIRYNVSLNNTNSDRNIELTVEGITNRKFSITLKMLNLLMYMVKSSGSQYGSLIECIKINHSNLKLSSQEPLTSGTDISIFNGKTNGDYNDIILEIQPYRNKDINFGFSLYSYAEDNSLSKILKNSYSFLTVQNSSFLGIRYNTETGFLNVSTNTQNSWTALSPRDEGIGNIVDVSSHYRFNPNSGLNLPTIDLFISNVLRYRVILSFNLKINCVSTGVCFFEFAEIEGVTNSSVAWPQTANHSLTLSNFKDDNRILIKYPDDTRFPINTYLFNLRYTISIEGYKYRDYDGTEKTSTDILPVYISNTNGILAIGRDYTEGNITNTMHIYFKANDASNNMYFEWGPDKPSNLPGLWQEQWYADEFMAELLGIHILLGFASYRFENNSIQTVIPVQKY